MGVPATVSITIDGNSVRTRSGTSVAAAMINAGSWRLRSAVNGEPRGPLCGMGVCYECRVTINGSRHERACLRPVEDGMDIRTHD